MNFGEWLSLSDVEREAEKRRWHAFEPGYWHSIAVEAAARFGHRRADKSTRPKRS